MNMPHTETGKVPLVIAMHPDDNVAVVVRAGGLPGGTEIRPGLVLAEHGHGAGTFQRLRRGWRREVGSLGHGARAGDDGQTRSGQVRGENQNLS